MQLFLVRHPAPLAATGLCYGQLEVEVEPLTAVRAAESVRQQIPSAVLESSTVYSSPSFRCLDLAQGLAAPHAPRIDGDLLEMSFGTWQGRRWDDIPREEIDAWAADLWNHRPGGGESAQMVAARWERWLTRIRQDSPRCCIVVTHAGVIRVALAHGEASEATGLNTPVAFGSVHLLRV
jgi:alpha-ribazole phosphatase